jgi:hypothetical protein
VERVHAGQGARLGYEPTWRAGAQVWRCAIRQVNVPGVRMYVGAGLGLSRSQIYVNQLILELVLHFLTETLQNICEHF